MPDPSVMSETYGSIGLPLPLCRPILVIVSRTSHGPTLMTSWAAQVLIDFARPSPSVIILPPLG